MTSKARIDKGLYWDRAWTLVEGCTPVSAGCDHCWSAAQAHMRAAQDNPRIKARYGGLTEAVVEADADFTRPHAPRFNGVVRPQWGALDLPQQVKKPTTFAVWNDLFHEDVPDRFIAEAYATMFAASQHTYLLLTKRHGRIGEGIGFPHVWRGVTAENQAIADVRIPILMVLNGNRWVSLEPMLGPVDLRPYLSGLRWVVCGPETGKHKRPCDPRWIEDLYAQCRAAGVPFFDKRKTGWLAREMPERA